MQNFIKKLQELPERKKKIILWTIVVVMGLILLSFFIKNTTQRLNKLQGNYFSPEMKVPELQKNLNSFPAQDMGSAINQIQQILNPSTSSGQVENNDQSQNQNESETETTK